MVSDLQTQIVNKMRREGGKHFAQMQQKVHKFPIPFAGHLIQLQHTTSGDIEYKVSKYSCGCTASTPHGFRASSGKSFRLKVTTTLAPD